MNFNISALKYFGKNFDSNTSSNRASQDDTETKRLIEQHSEETDEKLDSYRKQYALGEISPTEYKLAKLDATVEDIIYYLGIKSNKINKNV